MDKYTCLKKSIIKFENDDDYINYFKEFKDIFKYLDLGAFRDIINELISYTKENNMQKAMHYCFICSSLTEVYSLDSQLALDRIIKAKEFFEKEKNNYGIIVSYSAFVLYCSIVGEIELAIKYGLRGIKLAQKLKDDDFQIFFILSMANLHLETGDYIQVLKLIKRINELKTNIRKDFQIKIFNILSYIELHFNNITIAEKYCNKAIEMGADEKCSLEFVEALSNKAVIYYSLGKVKEAKECLNYAIRITDKNNNLYKKIKILILWSKCKNRCGEYKEAEKILTDILAQFDLDTFIGLNIEIYTELGDIYEHLEDYKSAYQSMKQYYKYKNIAGSYKNNLWLRILRNNNDFNEAKVYKDLYNKINVLSNIGKSIASNLDIDETLNLIYNEFKFLFEIDMFGIALYEEDEKLLKYRLIVDDNEKYEKIQLKIDDKGSIGAYCFRNKEEILINDFENEKDFYIKSSKCKLTKEDTPKSLIYIPIMMNDKAIGIITIQNYRKNAYNINHVKQLKILASYVAIALENGRLFNEVNYLANHDALTGALNRNMILKQGSDLLAKDTYPMSAAMIDVDFFKLVNDKHGHVTGDAVLKRICNLVNHEVDSSDLLGRYGGEEFLLLMPGRNIEEAFKLCEKIRKSCESYGNNSEELKADTNENKLTLSIGVYQFDKDEKELIGGIRKADHALYEAKRMGRNRVIKYHL